MDRQIIVDDLLTYYSVDELNEKLGCDINLVSDDALNTFFNNHCKEHSVKVSIKELYDKYYDSEFLINTPDGFVEVGALVKKSPRKIYTVRTPCHKIRCSLDHLLQTPDGWKRTDECKKHDLILTKDGYEEISSIRELKTDVVYDLEVLHKNHRYWAADGISSHNTGKTFLALSICRNAQKKGYIPIYMDSEGSIDIDFVKRLGCDTSRFILKQVTTITEVSTFMANVLQKLLATEEDKRDKVMFVLDSLGNLTSSKELNTTIEGGSVRDMTKQQEIKALFRTNTTSLAKAGALFVVNTHTYKTQDLYAKSIVSGGSGINYNSSVTLMLSTAKLEDKESEKIAEKKGGDYTKTGVIVTAKPEKSRFTIPQKVKFAIPFFKAPNPYVGLERYITWENSGILCGKILTQKEYDKCSDADKALCKEMKDKDGNICYAYPKETSRKIVVKHLGEELPISELFTSKVITDDVLRRLDDEVIRPNFELPSQDSMADVEEIFDKEEE